MSFSTASKNNPNPVPFVIKIESESDEELPVKTQTQNATPISTLKCCDHRQKLQEFKLKSNHTLQLALKTKTEEIRKLHNERRRLLEIEKKLLNKINSLKNKFKNIPVARSDSSEEKEAGDHFNPYRSSQKVNFIFFEKIFYFE